MWIIILKFGAFFFLYIAKIYIIPSPTLFPSSQKLKAYLKISRTEDKRQKVFCTLQDKKDNPFPQGVLTQKRPIRHKYRVVPRTTIKDLEEELAT